MTMDPGAVDLVVVGGGLAGLCAAVRAGELGLRAAVLERGTGEHYPCNSRWSGGIVHIAFRDPKRPAAELRNFIHAATGGKAEPELAEAVAVDGRRMIAWLQHHGARFMRFNMLEGYKWCMAPPRARGPGMDWRGRGPDVVLQRLVAALVTGGGALHQGTTALRLLVEEGRVSGVIASDGEGREHIWRGAVLIADGGFQADRELFARHIGPSFDRLLQRGAATGGGDGLRMAMAAGAAVTCCERFYGHLLHAEAAGNARLWPYPQADEIATAGIVVDASGSRVLDEGMGGIGIANQIARRPGAEPVFAVFDAGIWNGPARTARIPANPLMERAGATFHRGATPEELAATIGINPAGLARTVTVHNAALATAKTDALDPPRSAAPAARLLVEPPFMAIPLMAGITYTMGGIRIDGDGAVLRPDGTAIEGLFAAGAATGGLEGGGRFGYVGGLVKAGVFGLRAAERVARQRGLAKEEN